MWNLRTFVAMSSLALSVGAAANVPVESVAPVYIEGGQYTAVLNQRTQAWRLLPQDGIDLAVSSNGAGCHAGGHVPEGIWIVTSDAQGRPVLTAPSITDLPAGKWPPGWQPLSAAVTARSGPLAGSRRQAWVRWFNTALYWPPSM